MGACFFRSRLFITICLLAGSVHGVFADDPGKTEREITVGPPPYIIEPPDVLEIDAAKLIPKPSYRLEPMDVLTIQVVEGSPGQSPSREVVISPEGEISLGRFKGVIRIVGLTLEEAAITIRTALVRGEDSLADAQVSIRLMRFRGTQQTLGEHLVRRDGTISFGSYGIIRVSGLSLTQAQEAIKRRLAQYLLDPEIFVNVSAFNSKIYYVITDTGGYAKQVFHFPLCGKETVLDAVSNISGIGLDLSSNKAKIWVSRPSTMAPNGYRVLPVDWKALASAGDTDKNYPLQPGDQLFISAGSMDGDETFPALRAAAGWFERLTGMSLRGKTSIHASSDRTR